MLSFVKNYLAKKQGKNEYNIKLKQFLSDGHLDEDEKRELEELSKKHNLTGKDLSEAHKKACSIAFNNITSDKKITKDEKESLEGLMDYFKVDKTDFNFNQETFNKFYALGLIDKGILPDVKIDDLNIILKKGETVHWCCPASLRKLKRVSNRINYGGFTTSIKIAGNLRYRVGSIKYSTQSSEFLATEDTGNLWLTSQRLGFKGARKNFAIPYNKILSFDVSSAALSITKEGKETPILISLVDYDVPCSIISQILSSQQ